MWDEGRGMKMRKRKRKRKRLHEDGVWMRWALLRLMCLLAWLRE
jgi:hypothetical protein